MTHPTKAICPILLVKEQQSVLKALIVLSTLVFQEDYRKITVERKGEKESNFFTSQVNL